MLPKNVLFGVKQRILELRAKGYGYRTIARMVECSKTTVVYHCRPGAKQKSNARVYKTRNNAMAVLKLEAGGRCVLCGYSKCLAALDFDHIDPKTKTGSINKLIRVSIKLAREEVKKCRLICANCHREHHCSTVSG